MRCPKCGEDRQRLDALSRRDNNTKICSPCGVDEAFFDVGIYECLERRVITKVEAKVVRHNESRWLTGLPEASVSIG